MEVRSTVDGGRKTEGGRRWAEDERNNDRWIKEKPMSKLAQSFQELDVYQEALRFQQEVFEMTKRLPAEERFSLTDQIRRSSRAIGANIAESWAKRRYSAHFLSKLTDGDGELQETLHWLTSVAACSYIEQTEVQKLSARAATVGRLLGSTISNYESFCPRQ